MKDVYVNRTTNEKQNGKNQKLVCCTLECGRCDPSNYSGCNSSSGRTILSDTYVYVYPSGQAESLGVKVTAQA
jgi:hypothetical protein